MNETEVLKAWNYSAPLMRSRSIIIRQALRHFKLKRSDIKRFYLMYVLTNGLFKKRKWGLRRMVKDFYRLDYHLD